MKGETRNRSKIVATAFSRLQENAADLDADGIIGVKITHQSLGNSFREYNVTGTAVAEGVRRGDQPPFICTLSGQEYQLLLSSGYRPLGVAYGICVYFQKSHQRVQKKIEGSRNTERSDFTRGLYTARKYALAALHKQAQKLEADGILAINVSTERTLHRHVKTSVGMRIELTAIGTAVVLCPDRRMNINFVMPLGQ